MARGARVSITLDTNLSGLQTRTLGAFQLLMESKHLCESCCLERFGGLKQNLVAREVEEDVYLEAATERDSSCSVSFQYL